MSFQCPKCGHIEMTAREKKALAAEQRRAAKEQRRAAKQQRRVELDAAVRELQAQRVAQRKIAKRLGVSLYAVRASYARMGLKAEAQNAERHAAIVQHYNEHGRIAVATAVAFGISRERVRQVLNRSGITPRSRQEAGAERASGVDAIVARLHARGLWPSAIEQESGFSNGTVWRSLRRQSLEPHEQPPKPIAPRVQQALQMFDDGATAAGIADKLGYGSAASVRTLLHRYGRRFRDRHAVVEVAA